LFVAGFIGSPAMNLVTGTLSGTELVLPTVKVTLAPAQQAQVASYQGKSVVFGIRPEDLLDPELAKLSEDERTRYNSLSVQVQVVEYLGSENLVYFKIGDTRVTAKVGSESRIAAGQQVEFLYDPQKVHLFDPEQGQRIVE
jgi:multiple sugar transport system ATP-binding protein